MKNRTSAVSVLTGRCVPRCLVLFLLGFVSVFCAQRPAIAQIQIAPGIFTVAGTGTAGASGDGGAATSAQLSSPQGVAVDSAGNLYIADYANDVIREVSPSGTISTVAGTPDVAGYSGDGGTATSAQLSSPQSVAVDSAGNLYIADTGNNVVREIGPSGTISTVAGTGTAGYSGDGRAATSAKLNSPTGVALDSAGNLYIADTHNNVIREVSPSGTISTVAGNHAAGAGYSGDGGVATSAQLSSPTGVAADSAGNLYIADNGNSAIRLVTAANISTVAGNHTRGYSGDGGAAPNAQVDKSNGVAVDSAGNLYIADTDNNVIREVSTKTSFPATAVGSSSVTQNVLLELTASQTISSITAATSQGNQQEYVVGTVSGCAVDGSTSNSSGTVCTVPVTFQPSYPGQRSVPLTVISNTGTYSVGLSGIGTAPQVAFTPGTISTVAGTGTAGASGDSGPAASAQLSSPEGIAVDSAGNLYIADYDNSVIRKVSPSGTISAVAGTGTVGYSGDGGAAISAELNSPEGVAVDSAGNLYIADTGNNVIRKVSPSGTISTVAGTGTAGDSGDNGAATSAELSSPTGVAVDSAGSLYIADYKNSVIRKVSPSGTISTVAGTGTAGDSGDGGAATSAQLNKPNGVAVDSAGNLYIADTHNNVIRKVSSSSGNISTVAGGGSPSSGIGDGGAATSAQLNQPTGVVVDSAGNVYIADYRNSVIREVSSSSGYISTVAGGGSLSSGIGDGGAATSAQLNKPQGVAVDSTGNLYIADTSSNVIREVNVTRAPGISFATQTKVGHLDTTDGAQTVGVANIGNEPLAFTEPESGSNPSYPANFPVNTGDTNLCAAGTSLAQGASCDVSVNFAPASVGGLADDATLTDNALNVMTAGAGSGQQTISLNGTGVQSDDTTVTTTAASSGSLVYGQPVTLTAMVSDTTNAASIPTGTVTFTDIAGGTVTTLGPVALVNGEASYSYTLSATGAHTITSSYTPADSATFASSSDTAGTSFTVAAEVPTLRFGAIASQTYGNAPFSVSAASASSGALTYAVVSGPASISGPTVTLRGAGTITLSATQAADGNYTAATATIVVTVNKTAPAVALSSTPNPVLIANPVTLTATVSSGISGPTGTVTFYDGSSNTALGTSPVMAGVATLPISTLAVGVHSITAVYSGDADFVTLTSSAVSETVQDFSFTLSTSTGSTITQTVVPGGRANYELMVRPTNGTLFPAAVSFTASGLPPGATATFTPQTVPAGSGPTLARLSIQMPAQTARLVRDHYFGGGFVPVALGMLLLPFSTRLRRSARKLGRAGSLATLLLLLIGGFAGVAGLMGCGTSNGFLGQSPKDYTIRVTATSGALQHTVTAILNLQ